MHNYHYMLMWNQIGSILKSIQLNWEDKDFLLTSLLIKFGLKISLYLNGEFR